MASFKHYDRPSDHGQLEPHLALHRSNSSTENAQNTSKSFPWPRIPSLPFAAPRRPPIQPHQDSHQQDHSIHQHYHRNPLQHHIPAPPPHHNLLPPPSTQERRAKRGKPMARRSLQKLFDAAADDSTTWKSASSAGDFDDDDADTASGSANSSQTELCYPSQPQEHHQQNYTIHHQLSQELTSADIQQQPQPSQQHATHSSSSTTTTNTTSVPLLHLLTSDRGSSLTLMEIKAILYRVAQDLHTLHSANRIHRNVTLQNISLLCCGSIAAAALNPGSEESTITTTTMNTTTTTTTMMSNTTNTNSNSNNGRMDSSFSRCVWASRQHANDAYIAPEMACCSPDHSPFTMQTDIYALGIIMFVLLSGGNFPFGKEGLCDESSCPVVGSGCSVDEIQKWMNNSLMAQIQTMNRDNNMVVVVVDDNGSGSDKACGSNGSNNTKNQSTTTIMHDDDDNSNNNCLQILGFDHGATQLLLSMLHADPAQRPTTSSILSNPWLAEVSQYIPQVSIEKRKNNGNDGNVSLNTNTTTTTTTNTNNNNTVAAAMNTATVVVGMDVDGGIMTANTTSNVSMEESASMSLDGSDSLTLPGSKPECPYPVIGHVTQPLEVTVDGAKVLVSAVHAVYAVPGHGAMMSATPLALIPFAPSTTHHDTA